MAHFDERNIVSEHGTWAVTHQGIAALDYAMFFSADMLEVIANQTFDIPEYVNQEDLYAAVEAGLAYHGTTADDNDELIEEMRQDQNASIAYAQEVHPVDNQDDDVVDSNESEEEGQTPDFDEMTKAELVDYADEHNIDYPSRANKSEVLRLVKESETS